VETDLDDGPVSSNPSADWTKLLVALKSNIASSFLNGFNFVYGVINDLILGSAIVFQSFPFDEPPCPTLGNFRKGTGAVG
jgi:hypothetical protein